jgi:hypothetical protein
VTDARAVLSEKLLGTNSIPILNWTLELLKLGIEVLWGALYSMLDLESILIDVAVIVEVQTQTTKIWRTSVTKIG